MADTVARYLAWLVAAAVLALSLVPPQLRLRTGASHDVEHAAAFLLLGLAFALAYRNKTLPLALLGLAVIAGIELSQLLVPGRHATLADFLVNTVGFWAGIALSHALLLLVRKQRSFR